MFRRNRVHLVDAAQHTFAFRPDAPPALKVKSGETVTLETSSAPIERVMQFGDDWAAHFDAQRINAVTGPVFVEGARPGMALRVDVLDISVADWGWNAALPSMGALCHTVSEPMLRTVPIRDGRCWLTDALSVPVRPMIGCLGVAPARGASSTLAPPYPWAGNFDLLQVRPGATIWFPVQVAGALFSLGDLHAAMGAGEAPGVSIECAGSATVRLTLDADLDLQMPRIVVDDRLYCIGLAEQGRLEAARHHALDQLYNYLTAERRLTDADAYTYISAVGDLEFGGPAGAVVLASVPLEPLAARDRA